MGCPATAQEDQEVVPPGLRVLPNEAGVD